MKNGTGYRYGEKPHQVIYFLGGIYSPIKYEWSKEEIENHHDIRIRRFYCKEEVEKLIETMEKGAVLVTHEAPMGTITVPHREGSVPIRHLMDKTKPKFLIHGHHHRHYIKEEEITTIIGLGAINYDHISEYDITLP